MSKKYPTLHNLLSNLKFIGSDVFKFPKGVFNLDDIQDTTVAGYIVGGIQSTLPNTNSIADSAASPYIFKVILKSNCPKVSITSNPSPAIICQGNTVELTAKASEAVTYQWNLNGNAIVGANSSTYSTSNAGDYSVTVTNSNNCSVTSNVIVVTKELEVNIIPSNSIIQEGQTIILTAHVVDSPSNITRTIRQNDLIFVWKLNGTVIPDQISQTLKIPNAQVSNSGIYSVTVTDSQGNVGIGQARVLVETILSVNIEPSSLDICQGGAIRLNAVVAGGVPPYSFLWKGPNMFTSTDQSVNVDNATIANAGKYLVIVTDVNGFKNSASANVNVNACSDIAKAIKQKYC